MKQGRDEVTRFMCEVLRTRIEKRRARGTTRFGELETGCVRIGGINRQEDGLIKIVLNRGERGELALCGLELKSRRAAEK